MKIDGDQIYLTEKMLEIRRILLQSALFPETVKEFPSMNEDTVELESIVYNAIHNSLYNIHNGSHKTLKNTPTALFFALGGFDFSYYKGDIVASSARYNGFVDSFIFEPKSTTYYCQSPDYLYEILRHRDPYNIIYLGFVWFHFGKVKVFSDYIDTFPMDVEEFFSRGYASNPDVIKNEAIRKIYNTIVEQFWESDQRYIDKEWKDSLFETVKKRRECMEEYEHIIDKNVSNCSCWDCRIACWSNMWLLRKYIDYKEKRFFNMNK